MADSSVVVTSGVGTSIDTRTEGTNGHHRQVVVLGDPTTNAGVAPVDATAGLKVDLGADNDVTVTGTVDLGATDNAVLDAIEADTTSILADTTTIAGDTTSIDAKIPALGQALAAASVPVVLTAAQLTTLTPPAAITGFATSAKQDTIIGHVDGIETSLSSIDGKITAVNTGAVVVSSSALPSGASTAAKQPALGTAGTASADVITVQGIASMTALKVDGSAVTQPVSNAGITTIAGAVSGTEMQVDVLTMPTVAVTQSGTWDEVGINDSGNSITIDYNGSAISTSNAVPIQPPASGYLNIAIDQTGNNNAVDVLTLPALAAGTNAIGKLAANSGVDIGDVTLTAGTAAIGTVLPTDMDVTAHTNYKKFYYTNAGAVTDGIIWSPAAGKRWHVLQMKIQVSAACTVTLEDDKAGGDEVVDKYEFAANSGVSNIYPERYPWASGEDAADLLVTTSAGNIYISGVGYEI